MTGLIFGVIVVAWLAYLVPMLLRRDLASREAVPDPASRFSSSVQILQRGFVKAVEEDAGSSGVVRISTPLTRRAAAIAVRREERRAVGRRRNVLVVLLLVLVPAVVLSVAGALPGWALVVPGGLLAGFLAIARVSVRAMHREFDRRLTAIGEVGDEEDTVVLRFAEPARMGKRHKPAATATSVELGAPVGRPGTLWDPLPITRPTYVSAPLGRTVRTIDLSAPEPVGGNRPVIADAPEPSVMEVGRPVAADALPRAVGQ